MAKATVQQCHAMTTYFVKRYAEVLGKSTVVNRNKARWGFDSVLMDYTSDEAKELIDYYIKHWENPSIEWFLFNYEKVVEGLRDHNEREEIAAKRREQTAQRLEDWRARWQNQTP